MFCSKVSNMVFRRLIDQARLPRLFCGELRHEGPDHILPLVRLLGAVLHGDAVLRHSDVLVGHLSHTQLRHLRVNHTR